MRRILYGGSHGPQSRGHRRVHRRYRGMLSDLPERGAGRLVADGKWRSGAPIHAQFIRALVSICAERGRDEMGTVHDGTRRAGKRFDAFVAPVCGNTMLS